MSRPTQAAAGGQLAANIMYFGRALRAAGLPIGPGRLIDALRAVRTVGIANREDFYWTLHAVFVSRADQRALFDQAFHVFWRNPRILERMLALVLPGTSLPPGSNYQSLSRRLSEALTGHDGGGGRRAKMPPQIELDATLTWSGHERLQRKDFEEMSAGELAQAKAALARMQLPLAQLITRRFRAHPQGNRIDLRTTLRAALRAGHDIIPLARRRRRERPPPLVMLCDISGSMSRYSRMLLHFAHALTNDRDRVFTFVFGTRLTHITRCLRERDVDRALAKVSSTVQDWSGGTRIGHCLHEFNRNWSRRVLTQGALVLLVTDGLDRDIGAGLGQEMERLHKSCRRLLWLNPLLRYDGFQARALGMKAMLPHVDDFRSAHNLESLGELARALGRPGARRAEGVSQWLQH